MKKIAIIGLFLLGICLASLAYFVNQYNNEIKKGNQAMRDGLFEDAITYYENALEIKDTEKARILRDKAIKENEKVNEEVAADTKTKEENRDILIEYNSFLNWQTEVINEENQLINDYNEAFNKGRLTLAKNEELKTKYDDLLQRVKKKGIELSPALRQLNDLLVEEIQYRTLEEEEYIKGDIDKGMEYQTKAQDANIAFLEAIKDYDKPFGKLE